MKIAFLCPYFGNFPEHFQLLLNSCSFNKTCERFIFTDDNTSYDVPNNVHFYYCTLQEFKDFVDKRLGFFTGLKTIRKLGDFKPCLGYIFKELISNFDAWGHLDLNDSIYGDISKFVDDDILSRYEKILFCGHMSIYKNNASTNSRFMTKLKSGLDYKTILSDEKFYNFEEISNVSIGQIYIENNFNFYNPINAFADISNKTNHFRRSYVRFKNNRLIYKMHKFSREVYLFENGKLTRYFIKKGKVCYEELMYIHFKRRKMLVRCDLSSKSFSILPNGFYEKFPITKDTIRKNDKLGFNFKFYLEKIKWRG